MSATSASGRLAADVGDTFVEVVLQEPGARHHIEKLLAGPSDPSGSGSPR